MIRQVLAMLLLYTSAAWAADEAIMARGKVLAERNCARCHAIGATGKSPMPEAPPFRDIPQRYAAGELEDAFNEGVPTEHEAMPDWAMTPEQAEALAAYIMSLPQ